MKTIKMISLFAIFAIFISCENKPKNAPVDLGKSEVEITSDDIEVPYSELGGLKTIPVKLNGVSMDMIFDTGCSGMSISLNELLTMQKNGKISGSDIFGVTETTIADGSVVTNALINLSEVEIGGRDGIKLHNIKAGVVLNQVAPILLGNGVLDEVAAVEVDNMKKVIKFKRH